MNFLNGFKTIRVSTLLAIAFATVFFPRILDNWGAPSAVNFVHFAIVPLIVGIFLITSRKIKAQYALMHAEMLIGLYLFAIIGFASGFLNGVGVINILVSFLLWAEPFMFLVSAVKLSSSPGQVKEFRFWILGFLIFHLILALFQFVVLGHFGDSVQGVFYFSGSGHVVGASVSASLSLYTFSHLFKAPMWIRIAIASLSLIHIIISDAKQVIVVLVLAYALMVFINLVDIRRLFLYTIGLALFLYAFIWCVNTFPFLGAFKTWADLSLYGPDGDATLLKTAGIRIMIEHFQTPLNWLLGLGPGHTVDRLGGWMLKDYSSLLSPLGSTTSPVSDAVWAAVANSWLGDRSSFFSPFWGWSALWGDFGFIGLLAYLYLAMVVWRHLCVDDASRVLMLTVLIHGFIFTQMQEPGYMLTVACLIGLRWNEYQLEKLQKTTPVRVKLRYSLNT
ncbi:hypothetical protein HNI00_12825 [Thermoleptolyngbya oregonensis NK1-22]|uniref:Uncharacterized protein n=1 Tax=Thermoleptolyngbya oregonensis NK1-22 TaxID=2547457 RepID=A0AA97BDA6_9CYAN|nr:hypothetical protein [Thermoleptolyngbya oregonensis]WOB43931.1 hypothetical protein HNI00_12825 [Thermoleptolyngbya oregonensis NK1-22]